MLGQGLGSSSGEPGAWLKPAELSGGCSALCFLWRQGAFALSQLLAALSCSCKPRSCANITVVFAINSLLSAKKRLHVLDKGWEFWCSVRHKNVSREEVASSLLLKPIPRWPGLAAAPIRGDSLILLAPALCLHVPATLSKSKYTQSSISVRHIDWILLQENKSHGISLASLVPKALCCFRAAVCVCRRMVMGAVTFSWKYCSMPSSLASGQQLFFFFLFFHSSEEDLVSNYVKTLKVSFFFP